MLFEFVMPYISKQIESGVIVRWHKYEGDRLEFGDTILDLAALELRWRRRPDSASFVARLTEKRTVGNSSESKLGQRTDVRVPFRLTASDSAYLRSIEMDEGSRVTVGQVLALVSTLPDEPLDHDHGDPGQFHVVVNLLEGWEEV